MIDAAEQFHIICNNNCAAYTTQVVNELKNLIEIAKHGQRSAADNTKIEVLDINVAETTISFHKVRDVIV